MARESRSGTWQTDNERVTYVTFAQAKQSKSAQSKKCTGVLSPIDRVDVDICSDLKKPMTQMDRMGIRYLVNFAGLSTT